MRKLFFIAAVLFGLQGQAQKKFEVYNFSTYTVEIYDIITNASGSYPEFHSKGTQINIAAGDFYILENTSNVFRFPFDSPSSVPYIATWARANPAGYFSSSVAWTLGNAQTFSAMYLGVSNMVNGYVGVANPNISWTGGGNTLDVMYEMFVNPNNPNDITYTIVIQ